MADEQMPAHALEMLSEPGDLDQELVGALSHLVRTDRHGADARSLARRLAERSGLAMIALPPSEVTRDAIHLLRNRSRSALVAAFVAVLKEVAG